MNTNVSVTSKRNLSNKWGGWLGVEVGSTYQVTSKAP